MNSISNGRQYMHNMGRMQNDKQIEKEDQNIHNSSFPKLNQSDEEFLSAYDAYFNRLEQAAKKQAILNHQNQAQQTGHTEEPKIFKREALDFVKATAALQTAEVWTAKPAAKGAKPVKKHKKLKRFAFILVILASLYSLVVFSDIPFIAKWRTIYIETAMSTMNHQWLATAFFPDSVIEEVVQDRDNQQGLQSGMESDWSISVYSKRSLYHTWNKAQKDFDTIYSEIDQASFNAYLDAHGDEVIDDDGYLIIDQAGLSDGGTDIKTVYGDEVLAIDTYNALSIIKIKGDGYVGRLAIIKDPSRVGVGLSEDFGTKGALIGEISQSNDAVLAVNASGFYDPDGHGDGGQVFGLVMQNGEVLNQALGGANKLVGFDSKNRLEIGSSQSSFRFRDAVEFKPALIVNGEVLVEGSAGWGIQPRTAIGQTKNGEVLLLIIDGRSPGYSIGCTVGELAQILQRYGAYQACNLDGGSSSILYYNGRELSKPSAANKTLGRNIPDGFIVYNR